MGGCSVAAPIVGGRRRRSVKKTHKMRGGNFYSVSGGDPALGSAGPVVNSVENVPVDGNGNPMPEAVMPKVGGRRRRTSKKTRKGGKRRRGHKSRKMRGGAGFYSIAGVGAGYAGKGAAGLADYGGYSTKGPVAGGPTQGGDGVMRV